MFLCTPKPEGRGYIVFGADPVSVRSPFCFRALSPCEVFVLIGNSNHHLARFLKGGNLATTRENLSLGFPTQRDSHQSPQLL